MHIISVAKCEQPGIEAKFMVSGRDISELYIQDSTIVKGTVSDNFVIFLNVYACDIID